MVTARADVIQQHMQPLGWRMEDLASRMGVALNTVRNMLGGKGVGGNTIARVLEVFPGLNFDDLFEVQPTSARRTAEVAR